MTDKLLELRALFAVNFGPSIWLSGRGLFLQLKHDWQFMRNRISSSSEPSGRLGKFHDIDLVTSVSDEQFLAEQVCLFGPERYEPAYDYPLIVWLHSCRSSERELESVMPALSLQNYVAVAPRGTASCNASGSTYRWEDSPVATAIAEEIVFEAIAAACEQFSIANQRIFLAGFGSGATAAWRIGLRYPSQFAGVVAINGSFPYQANSLTNLEQARDLPTLWMYGDASERCGVQQVCDNLPLLHAARLRVDIRQYSCGTELLSNMLSDMNAWVMSHVTQTPATEEVVQEESFSRN